MDPNTLQEAVRATLTAGPAADLTLIRVVVHERTARGYRALVAADSGKLDAADWALTPSSTAWRAIVDQRRPVLVDATFGRVDVVDAAGRRTAIGGGLALSEASAVTLRGRGATHVLAAPILADGELAGMVCVELRQAPADDLPAATWAALLPLLTGAPRLSPAPVGKARLTGDPLLAVVGPATEPVVHALGRFAAREETILLRGPTGVGKTRLARWCHARSKRADGPFRTANLNALPATLFEGELFGWKRGAHSGATADHPGLVAQAQGGTLFLDEIDKLDLAGQHKILQLLESKVYQPLASTRPIEADVRFIVATNADLERRRDAGEFREDLYWRINELPAEVPGLDERREEIPLWAARFAADAGASLEPGTAAALAARSWPGNLRQLDRFLRRAAALADAGPEGTPRIDAEAVRRAGATDRPETGDLAARIEQLAVALADRLADGRGPPLVLEDLSLLRGLVLEAAARRMPLSDVYRALGEDRLVDSRNHQAAYKRDVARAREGLGKLRG